MQAVILIGIQGAGKSSFFKERFAHTHVQISLDLLKTRYRERLLMRECLTASQPFVIDNTNPTRQERATYIGAARANGFEVVGYYLQSIVADCVRRNGGRLGAACVPDIAIFSTSKKLEIPTQDEGFDRLFYVRLAGGQILEGGPSPGCGQFIVEDWQDEL